MSALKGWRTALSVREKRQKRSLRPKMEDTY